MLTGLVVLVGAVLWPQLGRVSPFLLLATCVAGSAWYGGLGPGLLATMLGLLAGDFFFLSPLHIPASDSSIRMVLFAITGAEISLLTGSLHRAAGRIRHQAELLGKLTERKLAEDELRRSRERYRSLYQAVSGGIVVHDQNGIITDANKFACELLGVTLDQLRGRTSTDPAWHAIHEDGSLWPGAEHLAVVSLRTGRSVRGEVMGIFHPPSASYRWILVNSEPIVAPESGAVQAVVATFLDVTEAKRAETLLRESEKRYRLLAENASDLITLHSPDGTVRYASPACRAILGYAPEELVGRSIFDLVHSEDLDYANAERVSVLQSGGGTHTGRIRRKDGNSIYVEVTTRAVRDAGGQVAEIHAIWRDVTERMLASQRTARLLEQVIAAQEEERRRISRELHDEIGQVLTSLLIGLRVLEQSATLHDAGEHARNLRQLVARGLDDVRRLAGGLRPAALDDLGLSAALERHADEYMRTHGIAVELHTGSLASERLPAPVEITVYRIVQEALTNAARHARARNVRIWLQRNDSGLNLSIADDGQGFDSDQELHTLDVARHMGLHSMRERAALLGGTLNIKSAPGRGTTIELQIPPNAGGTWPAQTPMSARPEGAVEG